MELKINLEDTVADHEWQESIATVIKNEMTNTVGGFVRKMVNDELKKQESVLKAQITRYVTDMLAPEQMKEMIKKATKGRSS